MNNLEAEFKQIRSQIIKGLIIGWLPITVFSLGLEETLSDLDRFSPEIKFIVQFIVFVIQFACTISFLSGYVICWKTCCKYAQYKGYSKYIGFFAGASNFYGLSFLFLLKNKHEKKIIREQKNDLESFSLTATALAIISLSILLYPFFALSMAISPSIRLEEAFNFANDKDLEIVFSFLIELALFWYFYQQISNSSVRLKFLLGTLNIANLKLSLGLAILEQSFGWGFNSLTLYIISFVFPGYVENYINQEHTNTHIGFIAYAILAVLFAPIWEEIFYRGLIFQKIALAKGLTFATLISALIFAVVHFRFDVIPLFIGGIIFVLLYLKTKQLAAPILSHFFYNLIAIAFSFHHQFISGFDHSVATTIAEYQEKVINNIGWNILFIAISAPYLIYFIYKNFPRNYDINKLPYFVNQEY